MFVNAPCLLASLGSVVASFMSCTLAAFMAFAAARASDLIAFLGITRAINHIKESGESERGPAYGRIFIFQLTVSFDVTGVWKVFLLARRCAVAENFPPPQIWFCRRGQCHSTVCPPR